MKTANDASAKFVIQWLRLFFAIHLIFAGFRFIIFQEIPPSPGHVGEFVTAMEHIWMYQAVKWLEAFVGILLLFDIAVPLALVLEVPVTITIFYLNTIVAGTALQKFTGPQELFLNGILLLAYGGYYARFLRVKAEPFWLWDGFRRKAE